MMNKINLFGKTLDELEFELSKINLPKFRAKQLAAWIYQRGVHSFDEMTDLSKSMRQNLSERYVIEGAKLISRLDSKDDLTTKYLLAMDGSTAVETVLMRHDYGNSICISTQAGCAMGCKFCASTVRGLERNLTSAEILSEVIFVNDQLRNTNQKVDTIVVMGIGEPLMNYDNLIRFLKLIHEPYTLGLSYRKITVSTCGIVPNIYKLAAENLPITLSISLHAPTDVLRSQLMPINERFNINEVVEAGGKYGDDTGRRVTYEYILIEEVNDTEEHARQLAKLLRKQLANVNLIPINPVSGKNFCRPSKERIKRFEEILKGCGIGATIRKEMGANINAACGQLRLKIMNQEQARGQ